MREWDFGGIVRALREKHGWTQEELADRLGCSLSYVSKIENGSRQPSYSVVEHILQKLGENSQDYSPLLVNADERYGYSVKTRLEQLHRQEDYVEMRRLVADAEGKKPFTSGLFRQVLLFYQVMTDEHVEKEERLERLMEAIGITVKDFNAEKLSVSVFSYTEIIIIDEIANAYHCLGDSEKAVQIMYGLKASLDRNYVDKWEQSRTYPTLLFNLSVYLGALERNDEMYDACVEAKRWAVRYNNTRALPSILATIAHCKFLKGDYIGMTDELLQAYMSARAMEKYRLATRISKVSKERYGIDLEVTFPEIMVKFSKFPDHTDCQAAE
ncbi:MAG: helix-turn-helix domain-containing protein [Oscillospiraceae bacterium]|jgi:transcriptional regulator with XRE-family HTH domain|nr:helix-turn-helix domain-containing protein [Oscillospiraceae bacterium]